MSQLRALLNNKASVYNLFLTQPSAWMAEQLGVFGLETLTLDLQHTLIEPSDWLGMMQGIKAGGSIPLARLPWNRPEYIMRALDYGVQGLICPMIETVEDVEAFVKAAKYPPQGNRSFGPIRAGLYGGPKYFEQANEQIVVFAMIETAAALENIEEIAQVPGLDGLYLGPFDLTASLGFPERANFADPKLQKIIEKVLEVSARNQLYSGVFTVDPFNAKAMAKKGFDLVTIGTEGILFREKVIEALGKLRP